MFSKKKVFEIDSRIIEIINKSKVEEELVEEAEKAIISFANNEEIARFFPKLTFILEGRSKTIEGASIEQTIKLVFKKGDFIDKKQLTKGKYIVKLPLTFLKSVAEKEEKNVFEFLRGTCKHEVAHLYHLKINESIGLREKAMKRLNKILKKEKKGIKIKNKELESVLTWVVALREILMGYLFSIHTEGIAFYTETQSSLPFNNNTFKELYLEAEKGTVKIMDYIKEMITIAGESKTGFLNSLSASLDKLSRAQEIKNLTYGIGRHMIYTILYSNKEMGLEEVFRLKPFKFIKVYEASCKMVGCKPVISLNSGMGILDYTSAINGFRKSFELIQESNKQ